MQTQADLDLIVFLSASGPCTLNTAPGKNWVEKSGGLPNYICNIAKAVMKSGKTKSAAIAIAVQRTKVWAAGGSDVSPQVRAKAAAAVAEWEKLRAKNAAKKIVAATHPSGDGQYIMLTDVGSFNTEIVRQAYNALQTQARIAAQEAAGENPNYGGPSPLPYSYVRELWTDYVIVCTEATSSEGDSMFKIPYTVNDDDVVFGEPVEVTQQYVEVNDSDDTESNDGDGLDDDTLELMKDILNPPKSATQRLTDMLTKGQNYAASGS